MKTYTAPSEVVFRSKAGSLSKKVTSELALIDSKFDEFDAASVLGALVSGKILVGNGSDVATAVEMSGDATIANTGAVTIANEAVTVGKMADLARGSIITGQTASNRPAALDAKSSGQILVGDGNDLASVAVSGDATLAATGALTAASRVKTKLAFLTAGMGTRTALATAGVDLATGSDAVYYGVFFAPVAITVETLEILVNEAYVKSSTDALVILKDSAGSPATIFTTTLNAAGVAAKTQVSVSPESGKASIAAGTRLDLNITATGAGGTGYVDVIMKYTID